MRLFNTRQILLAMLAVTLLVSPAIAQSPAQPDWKDGFRAHDKNGDGRIDRAEFQEWMAQAFYTRDRDRKGYLVVPDLQGVMSPEKFRAANRKGDGKLTMEELLNSVFHDFDAADVDRTGSLSMGEIEAYIHRDRK